MQFEVEIFRARNVVMLRCRGRLLLEHGAVLLDEVARHELSRGQDVALDLASVTQMDARGTGILAELCKTAREWGCLLVLAGVSDRVRRLLRLTRLDTLLRESTNNAGGTGLLEQIEMGLEPRRGLTFSRLVCGVAC